MGIFLTKEERENRGIKGGMFTVQESEILDKGIQRFMDLHGFSRDD